MQILFPSAEHAQYIADDQMLKTLCEKLSNRPYIALDTEFIRTDTFFPKLGLLQVSDGEQCYLIDPLALKDVTPFKKLLLSEDVVKVIHACSEDLETLFHSYGVMPCPLFDTQLAAAFLGYGLSMGYQRMVKDLFDVELSKAQNRSDWLQRPLDEKQCLYAALDVVYLLPAYHLFVDQLEKQGKTDWFNEKQSRVLDNFQQDEVTQNPYLRIKTAWRLAPKELAVLRALAAWREQTAIDLDLPRTWVVKDAVLFEIASRDIRSIQQLSEIGGLSPRVVRRHGEAILALLKECADVLPQHYPEALPKPLSAGSARQYKKTKKRVEQLAEGVGIASELLLSKKELEEYIRSGFGKNVRRFPELAVWRKQLLEQALGECLADSVDGMSDVDNA